jgi:hypothetical protein
MDENKLFEQKLFNFENMNSEKNNEINELRNKNAD